LLACELPAPVIVREQPAQFGPGAASPLFAAKLNHYARAPDFSGSALPFYEHDPSISAPLALPLLASFLNTRFAGT